MNKQEHLLVIFQEELIEVSMEFLSLSHQVSKALRFGLDEQRDLLPSNMERIEAEWNDLLGSVEKLRAVGIELKPDLEAIEKKMAKIDKYCTYAESLGTITDLGGDKLTGGEL